MGYIEGLLGTIAVLLLMILLNLNQLNARLKSRFPTAKEMQDEFVGD
jgi:hypothetical protein